MPKDKRWREKMRTDAHWAVRPKRLSSFFTCPKCKRESVTLNFLELNKKIRVSCNCCQLVDYLDYKGAAFGSIDYYSFFIDRYYQRFKETK